MIDQKMLDESFAKKQLEKILNSRIPNDEKQKNIFNIVNFIDEFEAKTRREEKGNTIIRSGGTKALDCFNCPGYREFGNQPK